MQHSATVSGGNSGGPLFDDCGWVIGVNTQRPHVGGGLTVGRHALLVDRALDDERLSRQHALFSRLDGTVCVEDLNSSDGTRVNGK